MVKNEGAIIERCLRSIIPLADLVIITDTGSTDDTIARAGLILQAHNIKFKIYTRDFVDFGHNRSLLLQIAKEEPVDFVLMVDADEVIEYADNFNAQTFKDNLNKDYFDVRMLAGGLTYYLPRLTSNKRDFKYVGVTHEFLDCAGLNGTAPEITLRQINDSYRRLTNNKFADDVKLLKNALKTEKDEGLKTRYMFYLAQSYQNMGEFVEAFRYYSARVDRGGWKDEVFYSYYQLGKIYEQTSSQECVDFYLKAYETLPCRVEPLCALRDFWNRSGKATLAGLIQNTIKTIPKPLSGLFIEESLYECTSPFSVTFA
jgi:glycosyltransferase involved in cell wall biosynthesis